MRLSAISAFSGAVSLILGLTVPALAGTPPPCIKAASSKNGDFLVLMNMQLDALQSNDGVARRIRGFSFEVFPRENFINAKDRLTAAGIYFSDWAQWGVALDRRNTTDQLFTSSCPLPLVTNDGEFLVLLAQVPAGSADWGVLRIYRRDRTSREIPDHGRLVREIALKEFYVPLYLIPVLEPPYCTDGSPVWFVGCSFGFSSDNRQLIYLSHYWHTVRITLGEGSVSSE